MLSDLLESGGQMIHIGEQCFEALARSTTSGQLQVLRRTHSSLMNDLEIDAKLIADQFGHSLDVTQNVYTKAALRRCQEAVRKLYEAVPKSLLEQNGASDAEEES